MNESTWYRDGLVTLTNGSDLVDGVGTQFIDNVLIGGIFFSPTGLVEVSRVVSDTRLQLVTPYGGPNAASVEYAIAPTQGAVVAATKQLQAFLVTLGPLKQAWEAGDLNAKGLELKGVKGSEAELPSSGNVAGDGWMVDGALFVWTGVAWSNQGQTVVSSDLVVLKDEAVAAKNQTEAIASAFGSAEAVVAEVQAVAETLPTTEQFTDLQVQVNAIETDPGDAVTQIFFPAVALQFLTGAGVALVSVASRLTGWTLPNGVDGRVGMVFASPSHWHTMFIDMHFVNLVANAGNLSIQGGARPWGDGDMVNVAPANSSGIVQLSSSTVAADATPYKAFTRTHSTALTVDATKKASLQVVRNGLSPNETLPNSVVLLGVTLRKAS